MKQLLHDLNTFKMRFQILPLEGNIGELREVTKFLIFPFVIQGDMRWLEKVTIIYQYSILLYGDSTYNNDVNYIWKPIKFKDNMTIADKTGDVAKICPRYDSSNTITELHIELKAGVTIKTSVIDDGADATMKLGFSTPEEF